MMMSFSVEHNWLNFLSYFRYSTIVCHRLTSVLISVQKILSMKFYEALLGMFGASTSRLKIRKVALQLPWVGQLVLVLLLQSFDKFIFV